MNIQSIIILIIIAVIVIMIFRNMHKNGVNTCGGNCGSCSMNCEKREYPLEIKKED